MVREVLKDKTRAAGGAQAKAHRRREAAFGAAGRVKGARAGRHRALAKAALTLSGELSLESLLHKIVDLSRSLLKAEYGALSVLQEDGSLARFLTSGVSQEERKRIGEPPQGRGLLGVILRQGQVLRLSDISKDPRSVGFPPRHPRVTSLLGVPIVSRGRILGNLYVANSAERTFSLKDQQLLEMFAAHAATAMENARLFTQAQEDRRSLAAIIESMQEGVYTVDRNRAIGLANKMAANLRGFQPKEVVGRYCGQVFNYHDDVGRSICDARCPAAECFRTGRGLLPREVYITSVSGEEVPVSLAAYPVVSADGQVNQVVEVFQDIRYRKEVDDLKSNIVSHVSHELRTPLAHIKGFSSSLLQDDVQWDAATQRDFLETIDREADRLSRLVGDLLAMSRIESGATARAERVPLDPAAVAQVGIDSVSSFTQHHKVRLEVDKALPTILGDSTQLEHVVANLVENAAKYSPRGKEVRVRVKRHGGEVVFSVADQGPGIAPEYHQKIFEKFYRVEVVGMPRAPGTGLGLSICKGIVEQHGGRIWIESALGHGATFSFALPAASSPIARRSAGKKGAIEGKKRS